MAVDAVLTVWSRFWPVGGCRGCPARLPNEGPPSAGCVSRSRPPPSGGHRGDGRRPESSAGPPALRQPSHRPRNGRGNRIGDQMWKNSQIRPLALRHLRSRKCKPAIITLRLRFQGLFFHTATAALTARQNRVKASR